MPQWRWILRAAALLLALAAFAWGAATPISAIDLQQPRFDQAAPIPHGPAVLEQTFTPGHDGLSAVELPAAVYADAQAGAALTIRLLDGSGRPAAAATFNGVTHNAPLRLSFSPQPVSAGQNYTLQLSGPPDNKATVWAYSLEGYPGGELRMAGVPVAGDLTFTTTYSYLPASMLHDTAIAAGRGLRLALPIWLLLFAPGLLALDWFVPGDAWPTRWARWGAALGLSLSFLALAWLWVGAIGLRWTPLTLGGLYAGIGAWVIGRFFWRGWRNRARVAAEVNPLDRAGLARFGWHDAALATILLVGLAIRFLAARDLVLPQWVDGPHHYTIARLLSETGQVPPGYWPVLPIDSFRYHFGFHAVAASLQWLSGQTLVDSFLWLGQLLQGLIPLAAYALVAIVTGRPRAGLLAAFFTGLVSYFPGYYLTWGRYTQLTGVLILAPALAGAWLLANPHPGPIRAPYERHLPLFLGLLGAGLLLTHYALFVVWLVFVGLAAVPGGSPAWRRVWLAALAGALAALPWLARLGRVTLQTLMAPQGLAAPAGYNAFPVDYFKSDLERAWLAAAVLALGWGLWRRERLAWLLGLWVAALSVMVNLGSGNWLVTNNTLAITLFVPGAAAIGWGGDRLLDGIATLLLKRGSPGSVARPMDIARLALGSVLAVAVAAALGYAAGRGARTQIGIINPVTVLVTPADRDGLDWVQTHLPPEAVVLINGWEWLNGTWAGSDSGAWIWPLTGRRTTIPPADYAYANAAWQKEVNDFNAQAAKIVDVDAPETLAFLRGAGVTHVFIGARGGTLKPEMFVGRQNYTLLYSNGSDWIFSVNAPE